MSEGESNHEEIPPTQEYQEEEDPRTEENKEIIKDDPKTSKVRTKGNYNIKKKHRISQCLFLNITELC